VSDPTATEAKTELDRLDALVEKTHDEYVKATGEVRRAWKPSRDVAASLAEHYKPLRGQGDADKDTARKLTVDVLRRIEKDDLLLEPLDPLRPAAGLKIVDPRPYRAQQEAHDAATAARNERDSFAVECRALLETAAARDAVDRVKDALDGEDPDVLREALAGVGVGDPTEPTALTTKDLP